MMDSTSARNTGPTTPANAWRPSAATNTAATPTAMIRPRGSGGRTGKASASAGAKESMALSDSLDGVDPAVLHGLEEGGVVVGVLVGVSCGELGDRLIDPGVAAEVLRDGYRVTGAGVRAGECPPAQPGVKRHSEGIHGLDRGRRLHVAQLAPVVEPVVLQPFGPAQEDVG